MEPYTEPKTPGQIAYEIWRKRRHLVKDWWHLSLNDRESWEAAACAVLEAASQEQASVTAGT